MPQLACWACGRQIYTVAPLASLFAEERRCPRCGARLRNDRREAERREVHRRVNPPDDPGPTVDDGERRVVARRVHRRRGGGPPPVAGGGSSGSPA